MDQIMSSLGINEMLKSYLLKTNDKTKLNDSLQQMVAMLRESNSDIIDEKTLNAFMGLGGCQKKKNVSAVHKRGDIAKDINSFNENISNVHEEYQPNMLDLKNSIRDRLIQISNNGLTHQYNNNLKNSNNDSFQYEDFAKDISNELHDIDTIEVDDVKNKPKEKYIEKHKKLKDRNKLLNQLKQFHVEHDIGKANNFILNK